MTPWFSRDFAFYLDPFWCIVCESNLVLILIIYIKFSKPQLFFNHFYVGSPDLVQLVQEKYFEKSGSKELPLIRAVVYNDWNQVMNCVAIDTNWKEALVAALTYAEQSQIGILCTELGLRLLDADMKEEALLCFICARNLEKVVSCWMETREGQDGPKALQVLNLESTVPCINFGTRIVIY